MHCHNMGRAFTPIKHATVLSSALTLMLAIGGTILPGTSARADEAPATHPPSQQEQDVQRLYDLLRSHYSGNENTPGEAAAPDEGTLRREQAEKEAERLAKMPYSADKVLLMGDEGSSVFAHFSRRLNDPRIPQARRDVAPICSVKTRVFDTLVDSDRLSLKPVGKQHYVAAVKLQPGESTFTIKTDKWRIDIPEATATREYLITFYHPPGGKPELHSFAIDDFLASDLPLIPAWLPADIKDKLNDPDETGQ